MATDPYAVLGLNRSATDDDIRRAFRTLAKKLHPDVNPGDQAAAERFKQVSQAYDLLGDPDKRRRYDAGEIDAAGGNALDLNVPAGVDDGRVLRLKGKGQPGVNGGPSGDALVEITVRPHRHFERDGKNIRSELPISIDEAVLGGKVAVDTIWGAVNLTIPKGTSSGQTFRLRGKGVKDDATGATGDQLVSVKIVLPDEIDDELAYFLTEWRQKHAYDPRR